MSSATLPEFERLQAIKRRAIDSAFDRIGARSCADLGGVWAVDAGYTFYGLARPTVERAVLVDTGVTNSVRRRAITEPRLRLVEADFGDPGTPAAVGAVDAVFLFDVLLHQARPDWDEIIHGYAVHTKAFVIVQPQYVAGPDTVRLVDLGKSRYEELVPHTTVHDEAWERLDEIHPKYGKPWRDIHEIWQWGIVDADLDRVCTAEGFELCHYENAGPWKDLVGFENHAFVYVRDAGPTGPSTVRAPGWQAPRDENRDAGDRRD